jgi:hypothetical protein
MGHDPFAGSPDKAAAAFLSGGNVSAVFPAVGHSYRGTVLDFKMRQRTDYDNGEPLYWEGKRAVAESKLKDPAKTATDDNAAMQLVIDLQCEPTGITWKGMEYDETKLDDDDGVRSLYVRGAVQKALSRELRRHGLQVPERGGLIEITRGPNGPKTDPKFRAPYTYTVTYTPADQNPDAAAKFLAGGEDDDPFEKETAPAGGVEKSPFD